MKKVLLFSVAAVLLACNPTKNMNADKADTTKTLAGADKDEHGCKGSAGYTWSVLKNDCIRTFEQQQLLPTEKQGTAVLAAFFLFNADSTKAELYLPNQKSSIILERSGTEGNYVWKKDDLSLIGAKPVVLKQADKLIFKGE